METVGANASITSMEGGSGEDSYAHNSLLQNFNFHTYAKPHLSQALDHLLLNLQYDANYSSSVQQLTIADFGCSYGRNTLDYAAFIVQGLYKRLISTTPRPNHPNGSSSSSTDQKQQHDQQQLEMQYFFADLPCNNFNALLQSLEPFLHHQLRCFEDDHDAVAPLQLTLLSGAVARSFHSQLFPTGSLHLAISSCALHWLSQVPPEVVDRASPAWNGGHIWIHGTRPKVVEAYARQFQKDVKAFLRNRAKEMAKGGILFLFFPCRDQKHPPGAFFSPHHDIWTGCYESTWEQMVLEGFIRKEERDMFNIPFYNCHKTEMQEALEELSNEFKVVKMEVMRDCKNLPKEEEKKIKGDPHAFGKFVATFVASLMKPMLQEYLNESRANDLFQRLQTQATKDARLSTSMTYDMLFAIIQRL